jgi:hypothetical protein
MLKVVGKKKETWWFDSQEVATKRRREAGLIDKKPRL